MTDPQTIIDSFGLYRQALAETTNLNKTALFDALAAGGITSVTVEFDGEGDSGQIESVIACAGETHVALPSTPLTVHRAHWHDRKSAMSVVEQPLPEAIETLCYDFLEQEYDGWENNDGGFGDFAFDVAARTIALEFNGRCSDTYTNNHSF